jgi:hypothetical protein
MRIYADMYIDPATGDLPEVTRLCTGIELIEQRIRLRLRRGIGEWFLDASVGLPLIEWFSGKPDPRVVTTTFERECRSVPGVIGTSGWSGNLNPTTRRLNVSGLVHTAEDGVTSLSVIGARELDRNGSIFGVFFSRALPVPISRPVFGGW